VGGIEKDATVDKVCLLSQFSTELPGGAENDGLKHCKNEGYFEFD
jgi:hypothetical protein